MPASPGSHKLGNVGADGLILLHIIQHSPFLLRLASLSDPGCKFPPLGLWVKLVFISSSRRKLCQVMYDLP